MSELKETWHFDPDNEGNSFLNGYGLLDQDGMEIGVFIETGGDFDDEEQRAKAHLVAAAPDLLEALQELGDWLAYGLGKPDGAEPTADELRRCKEVAAKAGAAIFKAKGPPTFEQVLERMRRNEGAGKDDE